MQAVEIEATNHCNTHCLHCPRGAITRPLGTMSWEVFQTIADKILLYPGFETVSFSGIGEPTLNPILPRFIAYLSERLTTYLTTNASTLSIEKIQELIDAGLENIIISFNGHNEEIFELMTGGLSYEKVIRVIQDLLRLGEGKIRVLANVSVTLQTQPHISRIKARLDDLGVQEIIFSQCHSRGGHLKDHTICQTPFPVIGTDRCDIFADILFVAWNGKVLACCHDLGGEGQIGNLVAEDLNLILEKQQQIVQRGVQFPMCKDCNDMYRFSRDPTPDGESLSEWIYSLYVNEDAEVTKLVDVIRQREARIRELEDLVAAYERGRFIRMMRKLRRVLGR